MSDPTPEERPGTRLQRIVIERWIDENGEEVITTDRGDASRLELIGMLEFAKLSVWNSDQEDERDRE